MTVNAIARQYANALFTVATREGHTSRVGQDVAALVSLVAEHEELRRVFESPAVPSKTKRAIVDALVAGSIDLSGEAARLLTLLADRDRLSLLGDVARAYAARVDDAERVIAADVVTAVELTADRRDALAEALGLATGRRVTITGRVDPSIVGGVVARVGGMVFDGSVAGQLERLRQRLSASV